MIKIGTLNAAALASHASLSVDALLAAQDTRLVRAEEAMAKFLSDTAERGDERRVVTEFLARCITPTEAVIAAEEAISLTFALQTLRPRVVRVSSYMRVRDRLLGSQVGFDCNGSEIDKIEEVKAAIEDLCPLLYHLTHS